MNQAQPSPSARLAKAAQLTPPRSPCRRQRGHMKHSGKEERETALLTLTPHS